MQESLLLVLIPAITGLTGVLINIVFSKSNSRDMAAEKVRANFVIDLKDTIRLLREDKQELFKNNRQLRSQIKELQDQVSGLEQKVSEWEGRPNREVRSETNEEE